MPKKLVPELTLDDFTKALEALERLHPTTEIELPTSSLFVLIGALQLAIRHPQLPRTSKRIISGLIEQIRDSLNEPVLMRMIDCGFDARYDIEPDGSKRPMDKGENDD